MSIVCYGPATEARAIHCAPSRTLTFLCAPAGCRVPIRIGTLPANLESRANFQIVVVVVAVAMWSHVEQLICVGRSASTHTNTTRRVINCLTLRTLRLLFTLVEALTQLKPNDKRDNNNSSSNNKLTLFLCFAFALFLFG